VDALAMVLIDVNFVLLVNVIIVLQFDKLHDSVYEDNSWIDCTFCQRF